MRSNDDNAILDSLVLPSNATMKIYELDSWDFSEVMDVGNGNFKITATCNIDGFEKLHPQEWNVVERDILVFGAGDIDEFKMYIMGSFENTLMLKKEHKLNQIKSAMRIILPNS